MTVCHGLVFATKFPSQTPFHAPGLVNAFELAMAPVLLASAPTRPARGQTHLFEHV